IVPIIREYRHQGKDKMAEKAVNIVATAIFVFIGLLTTIMWIYARPLTILLNPGKGFPASTIDIAVPLTRTLLPAQIFFFIGGLMMGVLYEKKRFLIPSLGPLIYNGGIIVGGVVLHRWLGIHGFIWGAFGGAFIGNFVLQVLAVKATGFHFRPSLDVLHPAAKKVWRMLLPIGLGVSLPSIDQLVNKWFSSHTAIGHTTALMNAYRYMLLPLGIFAQSMAIAAYPTLAHLAAEKNMRAFRSTINESLRNILFLTVPSAALLYVLSVPIITFLLQHGKFTVADTELTAAILRYLSLGIFAWGSASLLTRGFYALQNSKVPVISGACVSVLFIAMNWYVIRYHRLDWGVLGLGLSTSIAATIHAGLLLWLLRRRINGIQGLLLSVSVTRLAISTAVLCLVAWAVRIGMEHFLPLTVHPKVSSFAVICVAGIVGLIAYTATAVKLGMPEAQQIIGRVGHITGKLRAKLGFG
ncbi:MAG TPA: murein biosynthesis integral membrane protein MurJ, partial [Capsulimonadaceae bacterium]|nr:murein biosynthesis integral membrane protein MurJ [Capsulimonadaceae bacterium]